MKHILNDLTEKEKNAIREQHTGGMKIVNEKFSKLLNSKLGDSKPLVAEQVEEVKKTENSHLVKEQNILDNMVNSRTQVVQSLHNNGWQLAPANNADVRTAFVDKGGALMIRGYEGKPLVFTKPGYNCVIRKDGKTVLCSGGGKLSDFVLPNQLQEVLRWISSSN
jgi:hypothetical protein